MEQTMTPQEAAIERRKLISAMDETSAKLAAFCQPHRNNMGLVPDEIRKSDEYTRLNRDYYTAKAHLQSFLKLHQGKEYAKAFKAETIEHYQQKRSK